MSRREEVEKFIVDKRMDMVAARYEEKMLALADEVDALRAVVTKLLAML